MSYVAATFLMQMNVENAFWTFLTLVDNHMIVKQKKKIEISIFKTVNRVLLILNYLEWLKMVLFLINCYQIHFQVFIF